MRRWPPSRLWQGLRDRRVANPVVLTGDEHQNYAGELHLDGRRPNREPIAAEFVATSITSGGDGEDQSDQTVAIQAANPQLKFHNSLRGFLMCDVSHKRWVTQYKVLDRVSVPGAPLRTRAAWALEDGSSRLATA